MARVAIPITKLAHPPEFTFTNQIAEVFEQEGVWNPVEDFTYTGRMTIDPKRADAVQLKARIARRLRELLSAEEADRLIGFLEECSWDASFFVDCW